MLKVGDKVKRRPETFHDPEEGRWAMMEGTVVYIHPEGRYHTVEFSFGYGRKARESFLGATA